jgi:hypothetical protein
MRVPPGHARNWKKHCGAYSACGQPVYFVHNDWYNDVYAPHYREQHGRGNDHDNGKSNGHGKSNGNGKGHGNGKGNKH